MAPKPNEYGDIDSRAKFRARVAEVLALAEKCEKKAPQDPSIRSIAAQLRVMKKNTANGRDPSPDERKGITAGLIAIRELEGSADDDVAASVAGAPRP